MERRYATNPDQLLSFETDELRRCYLVPEVFVPGQMTAPYTHHDRIVFGGAVPAGTPLPLPTFHELRAEFFLANRKLGIVNVGGTGSVIADAQSYTRPSVAWRTSAEARGT